MILTTVSPCQLHYIVWQIGSDLNKKKFYSKIAN